MLIGCHSFQRLSRPEVDTTDFTKFNYWDGGRKGLLSGEALHADIKRMEMAYHENNRRGLELTRHISLRQLDPLALLRLKATGTATFTIPEWLFDLDYPGQYMRRIKQLSVSVPSVVGSYTPVPCQLSLRRTTIRVSPQLNDSYARDTDEEDNRFVDMYMFGPIDQIATGSGTQDSGMFELSQRDERLLPFENAGVVSTSNIDLPTELRSFDYCTISDVVIHLRYTARQGGQLLGGKAIKELKEAMSSSSQLALLFSLRDDFPTEWAVFTTGTDDLKGDLRKSFFPYLVQKRTLIVADTVELCRDPAAGRPFGGNSGDLVRRTQPRTVPSHTEPDQLRTGGHSDRTTGGIHPWARSATTK